MTGDDRVTDEMIKRSHQIVDDVLDMALYLRSCSPENIGRYQDAANRLAHFMDEVRAALSAAFKTKQPVAVEMEKLEWSPAEGKPGCDVRAQPDPYHHYTVRHLSDGRFDLILTTDLGVKYFQENGVEYHSSYAAAKAAAQQDYETRIRSAIVEVPVETVEFPADLVMRCEEVLDWQQTGILQDSADLRDLASRIRRKFGDTLSEGEAIAHAEEKTKREAMRLVLALSTRIADRAEQDDSAITTKGSDHE